MTKLKSRLEKPFFIIAMAFLFIAVLGMATGGVAGQGGISPEAVPQSIIPNPMLNVNTTWNNFYSGYSPLEYNNGTGNATLHAGLSNYYKNPITVNPAKIETSALQGTIMGMNWKNGSAYWEPKGGVSATNNSNSITFKTTTTNTTAFTYYNEIITFKTSYFPSANMKYDYLTVIGNFSQDVKTTNGLYFNMAVANSTGCYTYPIEVHNGTASTGTTNHNVQDNSPFYMSFPMSIFPVSNATTYKLQIYQYLPASAGSDYTTLTGMAMTTNPITFGTSTNAKGQTITPMAKFGNLELSTFDPDISYSKVANQGYTVATSQTLQNLTVSQASINNGKYIEEATYQGNLILPDVPSLTYGNANISLPITIDGSQYNVFTINGASEISNIYNKTNGTFVMSGINPMHKNTVVIETQYTASQWDSVSAPPSFWTEPIQAMEYYWYVMLAIGLGAVGLGAGFKGKASAFRGAKR